MRFDYEQAVLKRSKSKGIARLVLMILAVHSNKDGQCWPLVGTIAAEANSSVPAVNRAIAKLKALGEIETSDLRGRGRSSIYKILIPLIDEKSIENDSLTDEKSIEFDRAKETKSIESDSLNKKSLSLLKRKSIEFDRQNKQEQTIKEEQKEHFNNLASSLASVCQVNIDTLSDKKRESLKSLVVTLARQDVTVDDIKAFGLYWLAHDWRGQKGQHPTPAQVGDEWGAFEASRGNKGRSPPNGHYYAGPPGLTEEKRKLIEQMRKDDEC